MKRPLPLATIIRAGLILALVVVLEAVCRMGLITQITMVPPTVMVTAAFTALFDPALRASILLTLEEVVIAVVLSVAVGIAVGIGLFASKRLRAIADPILSAWYAVPIFVFYPVMIVIFGIGQQSIVAISFVFSLAAMVLSTCNALNRIPQPLFKTARLLQLGPLRRVAFILLPAALPHLVVGLRLVLAYTLIATIAGEFILSSAGLGHEISFAYDNFATAEMYGLILIVISAAVGLNAALSALVKRLGGTMPVKSAQGG